MNTNTNKQSVHTALLFKPRKKHLLKATSGKALSTAIHAYKHTKQPLKAYHRTNRFTGTMPIDTIIAAFLKTITPPAQHSKLKNSA